jgi:hypothetical protein
MSRRRPLVYLSAAAAEQARILVGESIVVENVISAAISRGQVSASSRGAMVRCGEFLALCKKQPGRLRRRPGAWLVHELRPEEESAR